jgi:HSP20 family protein
MARNLLPDFWRRERNASSPVRELSNLQHRMNRLFEEFFTDPLTSLVQPAWDTLGAESAFIPSCDIDETDSQYLVSFDIPGVKKDKVKIELRDNELMVTGERKQEHKDEAKGRLSRERYYGSFVRTITLPPGIHAEKVEARFENGVLQVALPKVKATKPTQIPIQEGKLIEVKSEKAA